MARTIAKAPRRDASFARFQELDELRISPRDLASPDRPDKWGDWLRANAPWLVAIGVFGLWIWSLRGEKQELLELAMASAASRPELGFVEQIAAAGIMVLAGIGAVIVMIAVAVFLAIRGGAKP